MAFFDEARVRVILLDIEGTTTPVDFVTKTLFPYASRKLESFLREYSGNHEIRRVIEGLRAQQELDERKGLKPPSWRDDSEEERVRSSVAYCQWLIAKDSKGAPLKSLQGRIWQQGYSSGELKGEVYPDVPAAFERWKKQGKTICIYSSGSVLAQRLLFQTTVYGDLTRLIHAFFDTRVGAKTEAESYRKIAMSLSYEPRAVLFISDATKEIAAAQAVGMQTLLCERGSHSAEPPETQKIIHDFNGVFPN